MNSIKNRDIDKKILQVTNNFKTLKKHTRIPQKFKNQIRRSKSTTFIYPNLKSFRIVSPVSIHNNFINKVDIIYSTSANITNEKFDYKVAFKLSDVVIYNKKDFTEKESSEIIKLTNHKRKKLR